MYAVISKSLHKAGQPEDLSGFCGSNPGDRGQQLVRSLATREGSRFLRKEVGFAGLAQKRKTTRLMLGAKFFA